MPPERAKALEAVAEAARALFDGSPVLPFQALASAIDALDALPAEPADAGDMVEVRADVYLSPACSEPLVCPSGFVPYRGVRLATITARIPRPVVPEVRAEVET